MKVLDQSQCLLLPSEVLDLLEVDLGAATLAGADAISDFSRRKAILHVRLAEYIQDSCESSETVDSLGSFGLSDATLVRLLYLRSCRKLPLLSLYVDQVLQGGGFSVEAICAVLTEDKCSASQNKRPRQSE